LTEINELDRNMVYDRTLWRNLINVLLVYITQTYFRVF